MTVQTPLGFSRYVGGLRWEALYERRDLERRARDEQPYEVVEVVPFTGDDPEDDAE